MFGLAEEEKKYTNYKMIIYSKWKCNPLPLQCFARRTHKKHSPLLFEKLKYQIQTFHTHIHTTAATNPTQCYEFRESRHSDTTAFVWRVFLVSTAVARPYELVPESSKFQLERHNLPRKHVYSYFIFTSFLFHLFPDCIVALAACLAFACLYSSVHYFEHEKH